jgi:hypothetical protein
MFCLWLLVLIVLTPSAAVLDQRGDPGTSSAQDNVEEYLSVVCKENNEWSTPSRPCEDMYAISYQCVTGLDFEDDVDLAEQHDSDCGDDCQSYEFQRTCICQSQWLHRASGCFQCYEKHGGNYSEFITSYQWTGLPKLFKDYCDPSENPTAGFYERLDSLSTSSEVTSTTTFSDPLGFKQTEVSLYYDALPIGPAVWSTTLSTITDWSSDAIKSYISTDSSDVAPATDEYTPRPVSTIASVPTASGPIVTVIPPSIAILPVWPNASTASIPSLYHETNASSKNGVSVGMLVGILGILVMARML